MSEEAILTLVNKIQDNPNILDKLNFEELEMVNNYLLEHNLTNILSLLEEMSDINDER